MTPRFLDNPKTPIIIDASVVINLIASQLAHDILRSLPFRVFIVNEVYGEIENGQKRGREDFKILTNLVRENLVEVVNLRDMAILTFLNLTIGDTASTLDDGEAATIAYANDCNGSAVIDEKKARRICSQHFQTLPIFCTFDIFLHPNLKNALDQEALRNAILNALRDARMSIPPNYADQIRKFIGEENLSSYSSLPRNIREIK